MTSKTVAIIGAGASGLVTAKALIQDGFDVTIFDRENHLGGIWSPDQASRSTNSNHSWLYGIF